ncbi:MAG: hypothetical protein AAGJ40_11285 [Planctomycetota bacterium]
MSLTRSGDRPWMKWVLLAAGIYNLVWGAWVIARPMDLFDMTGITRPIYPGIWQCVGMIVGVYGIGYAIASTNPLRHWPIVLVGFLGKIFGPIGMLQNVWMVPVGTPGRLPASWLWLNVTNDFIWLLPFGVILYASFNAWNDPSHRSGLDVGDSGLGPKMRWSSVTDANANVRTQLGATIQQLSQGRNALVVFLRHSGCTFCREALAEIARDRAAIESDATIVLVHMGSEDPKSQAYFDSYGLGDVHRISDPLCELYHAYELRRGHVGQLFGASVWWRGFKAAILKRHFVGKLGGDGFQLSGSFVVRDNQITKSVRYESAADRADYCALAKS